MKLSVEHDYLLVQMETPQDLLWIEKVLNLGKPGKSVRLFRYECGDPIDQTQVFLTTEKLDSYKEG